MAKYTQYMEAALTRMPLSDTIQASSQTIRAMERRGLCYDVVLGMSGEYEAKLTSYRHEARVEVAVARGESLLKFLEQARRGRAVSNGVMRINRARESARLVALLTMGRPLTANENRLVGEVTERIIDIFEEGSTRVLFCPDCDHVLTSDERKGTVPCPEHGLRAGFISPIGLSDLAVRYRTP